MNRFLMVSFTLMLSDNVHAGTQQIATGSNDPITEKGTAEYVTGDKGHSDVVKRARERAEELVNNEACRRFGLDVDSTFKSRKEEDDRGYRESASSIQTVQCKAKDVKIQKMEAPSCVPTRSNPPKVECTITAKIID